MHPLDWLTTTPRLDSIDYAKKPCVTLRFISLVFSIVLIALLRNGCDMYGRCIFNDDASACGFGVFLGSSTLIYCFTFLLLDLCADNISNLNIRSKVTLTDLSFAGLWSFFWFIGFCLLCNRWQHTEDKLLQELEISPSGARVAITFTFLTLLSMGILAYFCYTAYQRVRLLIADSEITSNPAYNFGGPPDSGVTAYHGFARDADLLDISKPAQLDTSPPSFGGSPRFGGGGVLTRNPVEA